jgi:hypothetical protein
MTTMTTATNTPSPSGDSYDDGYFDGELDAISKLPAIQVEARASMGAEHDDLWAQGYSDGYLNQIQITYALAQNQTTTP